MPYKYSKVDLIELCLFHEIIGLDFKKPVTFKSGIKSPIYSDFRKTLEYPRLMQLIRDGLRNIMPDARIDVIAGVATGALPHASFLAMEMEFPLAYVRPEAKPKDYGLRKLIEGAKVEGKKIFLIEDLITSGGSLINDIEIYKQEGAAAVYPASIFTYGFDRSKREFADAGLECHSILTISDFLPEFEKRLSEEDYSSLIDFIAEPEGWHARHFSNSPK